MSKKKKEKVPRALPRFAAGAQVRVKPGTIDLDFPDIPLDRHLAAHLKVPFEAKWEPEYGPRQTIKITGMGEFDDESWADEMSGLLCEARVEGRLIEVPLAECEAKKGNPNRQLLQDYSYWFWNNR
jgi:hypothetical protein